MQVAVAGDGGPLHPDGAGVCRARDPLWGQARAPRGTHQPLADADCMSFLDTLFSFLDTQVSFLDTLLSFLDTLLSFLDTLLSFLDTPCSFLDTLFPMLTALGFVALAGAVQGVQDEDGAERRGSRKQAAGLSSNHLHGPRHRKRAASGHGDILICPSREGDTRHRPAVTPQPQL